MLTEIDETNIECYRNLSQHYEAEFSILTGKRPDINGLYTIKNINENYKGYLFYSKEQLPFKISPILGLIFLCYKQMSKYNKILNFFKIFNQFRRIL